MLLHQQRVVFCAGKLDEINDFHKVEVNRHAQFKEISLDLKHQSMFIPAFIQTSIHKYSINKIIINLKNEGKNERQVMK